MVFWNSVYLRPFHVQKCNNLTHPSLSETDLFGKGCIETRRDCHIFINCIFSTWSEDCLIWWASNCQQLTSKDTLQGSCGESQVQLNVSVPAYQIWSLTPALKGNSDMTVSAKTKNKAMDVLYIVIYIYFFLESNKQKGELSMYCGSKITNLKSYPIFEREMV